MSDNLFARLDDGATVVTPSSRLAKLITDRYHTWKSAGGDACWAAPSIMSFSAWLSETYKSATLTTPELVGATGLLSVDQEFLLWVQIIRRRLDDLGTAQINALAGLAQRAWASVHLWEIPIELLKQHASSQEALMFITWSHEFLQRSNDLGLTDLHSHATWLAHQTDATADQQKHIVFYGYTRDYPLVKRLVQNLPAGSVRPVATSGGQTRSADYRQFAQLKNELSAAMQWAAREKTKNPQASLLIAYTGKTRIDPNLAQSLSRAFNLGFGNGRSGGAPHLDCFADVALSEIPIIQSAMRLLDWRPVRSWDDMSCLILDPYLGDAGVERQQRALLDRNLRSRGGVDISIASAIDAAAQESTLCVGLSARFAALQIRTSETSRRQSLHAWIDHAEGILKAAGWPGDQVLNDSEQTAFDEWGRVMDSIASLNVVLSACAWYEALRYWRTILQRRRVSLPAPVNSVQVVSIEEAAFIDADAIWVVDLHDGTWPEPVASNPLLPFSLQRSSGLAGADPKVERKHAERVLVTLQTRHPRAIWSYAATHAETHRRPLNSWHYAAQSEPLDELWPRAAVGFESFDDTYARALATSAKVGGGVALFTDQAACPMRAVAYHRLRARSPRDPTPGFDPIQRGILLHALMAAIWQRLKTQAVLIAMDTATLQRTIDGCAEGVLTRFSGRRGVADKYLALEHDRLTRLAEDWLVHERKRADFEVIACEQARTASFGTFTINTRLDRIDRLANGKELIIDYKTGDASSSSWQAPRIDQPQLPLYAVSTEDSAVGGIAFARIKKGASKIVSEPPNIIDRNDPSDEEVESWQGNLDTWRAALAELAHEVSEGYALADPKHGLSTCRYCDLQTLCRIHEAGTADVGDDNAK